jgi:hypothetical protein
MLDNNFHGSAKFAWPPARAPGSRLSAAVTAPAPTSARTRRPAPAQRYGWSKLVRPLGRPPDHGDARVVGLRYSTSTGREAHKGRMASVVHHFDQQLRTMARSPLRRLARVGDGPPAISSMSTTSSRSISGDGDACGARPLQRRHRCEPASTTSPAPSSPSVAAAPSPTSRCRPTAGAYQAFTEAALPPPDGGHRVPQTRRRPADANRRL